jgi:hypothetical protein
MRLVREAFVLLLPAAMSALVPTAALARAWQGVHPGSTTEAEVTARFGPPSTEGKLSGRTALVYKGDQAIPGTRQAQFFTREDRVVIEVVVFPVTQLDREAVEGTYGKPTQKAFTDDFRSVWFFKPSGVTVYFGKDGFVDAVSFKPAPGARPEGPRPAAVKPGRSTAPASPAAN